MLTRRCKNRALEAQIDAQAQAQGSDHQLTGLKLITLREIYQAANWIDWCTKTLLEVLAGIRQIFDVSKLDDVVNFHKFEQV